MIGSFSTALATALGSFVTNITTGIGDNLVIVLPVVLGVIGIFLLWRIVKRFINP